MENFPFITILLIAVTIFFSSKGMMSPAFFASWLFDVDQILVHKDYKRIVTSGFLHLDWLHLVFNMYSLWVFGSFLEAYTGPWLFLLIYGGSLIGGDLLSLFLHRHHGNYTAAGASGAVCGVIFASLALFPGMEIGLFISSLSIYGWVYGLLYLGYTVYSVVRRDMRVGHDAHLGGALIGMLIVIAVYPRVLQTNLITILLLLAPCAFFFWLLWRRPRFLVTGRAFRTEEQQYLTMDDRYNLNRAQKERDIDRILDKIGSKGMDSLSEKEKEILKNSSQ